MQDKNSGEFAVDLSTLADNPHCPHGPTILFRRSTNTSTKDAYYACSAYRDSKECRFFEAFSAKKTSKQPQSTATTGGKKRKRDELLESHRPTASRSDGTKVSYCTRCSRILEENDVEGHKHSEVELVDPRFPSRFLLPLSGKQAEAQYFFSGKTTNFLLNLLKSQEVNVKTWLVQYVCFCLIAWFNKFYWMVKRLVDWLIDWLIDWLLPCLIDWLIVWLIDN